MVIRPSQTVGQIAVGTKDSIPIFEKHGIDYCFQGAKTLRNACYEAGVPLEEVLFELEKVQSRPLEWYLAERDWRRETMAELIDYIVRVHHAFCREQTLRIEKLLEEAIATGKKPNPNLALIQELFRRMSGELENHLREEEEEAFPYLIQVEKAIFKKEPVPHPFKGYSFFNHPLRILQWEHGLMGREWRDIHRLTNHFETTEDNKDLLDPIYEAMKKLELDSRQHVHLENNILLERALKLGLLDEEPASENT